MNLQEKFFEHADRGVMDTDEYANESVIEIVKIAEEFALKFGEYIQDCLAGEDWFLLDKTVEELLEDFKKQNI